MSQLILLQTRKKTFYSKQGPYETNFNTCTVFVFFWKYILKRIITIKVPISCLLILYYVNFKSVFLCFGEVIFAHLFQLLNNNVAQDILNRMRISIRPYQSNIYQTIPSYQRSPHSSLLLNAHFTCFNSYLWRTTLSKG